MLNQAHMLRNLLHKWWLPTLCVGILIRLILIPITYHQDLLGHSIAGYYFSYEGIINIYDFLFYLPQDHPLVKNIGVADIFIYPPLTHYTLGIFRILLKPFLDPLFIPWTYTNLSSIYSYPGFTLQLFLFKLPYLFIDVACAFLLSKLFNVAKRQQLAFKLWMFNPVTIYATFMIGQIDILPVFFTIIACYFVKRKNYGWALFMLGIGAAYKTYPLLLIPPAAFLLGGNFWNKVKLLFIGLLPYLLIIAPYLGSKGFRAMVLFGPKETKMLFMNWPLTAAEGIFPFILILSLIYLISYYRAGNLRLEYFFLTILLLIFSVTHFHPQWFLWVTPFLIWAIIKSEFVYWEIISLLMVIWLIITLFFEPSLSWGLFTYVWPDLAKTPGLTEMLTGYVDVAQFKSFLRSVFAGCALFYCWIIARETIQSKTKNVV